MTRQGAVRGSGTILFPVLLVLGCALLPYIFLPSKPFYSDAQMAVGRNETVRKASYGELLRTDFWGNPLASKKSTGSYRPLVVATYALEARELGAKPLPFHLTDMALHGLVALLVLFLLRRLFPGSRAVFPAAALFAVHPVLSEGVCSVTGRADMMAAAAMLGALLLHLRARDGRRAWLLELGALVCIALGLLSKEYAVTFPLILIGADGAAWVAGRIPRDQRRRIVVAGALGVAMVAAYLALRFALIGALTGVAIVAPGDQPLYGASFLVRAATGASLLARAARLVLIPVGLSYQYGKGTWPVAKGFADPWALLGVALVLVAGVLSWRFARRRRDPVPGTAFLLFILPLAPVLNVIVLVPAFFAERLLYLPAVALPIMVAWALHALERRPALRWAATAVVGAVAVLFAGLTLMRVDDWASTETLARATLKVYPKSANALFELGQVLSARGESKEAADILRRSLNVEDRRAAVWVAYGKALRNLGKHEDAAHAWRRALETSGTRDWRLLAELGESELEAGRPAEAAAALEEARGKAPDSGSVEPLLGRALLRVAQQKLAAGDSEAAKLEVGRALDEGALPAEGYFLAGLILQHTQEPREAARLFRRALEMDPDLLKKKHEAAMRMEKQGRYREAASLLREILAAAPSNAPTLFNLGRLLVMSDRPEAAIPYLEAGLRIVDDSRDRALLREARLRSKEAQR